MIGEAATETPPRRDPYASNPHTYLTFVHAKLYHCLMSPPTPHPHPITMATVASFIFSLKQSDLSVHFG